MLKGRMDTDLPWLNEVPYEVLDVALREATVASEGVREKNKEAREAGQPAIHRLGFRRKKDIRSTIVVRARNVGDDLRMYPNFLHTQKATWDIAPEIFARFPSFTFPLKPQSWYDPTLPGPRQPNPVGIYPMHHEKKHVNNNGWPESEDVECDSSLTYDRLTRKFTFNWVYLKTPPEKNASDLENQEVFFAPPPPPPAPVAGPSNAPLPPSPRGSHIIALDPGVRAFLTGYSPTKGTVELGGVRPTLPPGVAPPTIPHRARRRGRNANRPQKPVLTDADHIFRLVMFVDHLVAKTAAAPKRKRVNMRRAQARARDRIRWLVKEMHHKAAHFLTTEFDIIVLPVFNATMMSKRANRVIRSDVVRKMLTWAHGRFREFLKQKAEERGKLVISPLEAYTTKTCTSCGRINNSVGGSKVFLCRVDRGGCGLRINRDVNGAIGILLRTFFEGYLGLEDDD